MLKASEFDFQLPADRIAQNAVRRGASRLLVLPKAGGWPQHARFRQLAEFLRPGDCLVVNNTKVLPARFWARKAGTGARVEFLLHREQAPGRWEALARPCKRLRPGTELEIFGNPIKVLTILNQGRVVVQFADSQAARRVMTKYGVAPLPPYIARQPEEKRSSDQRRYQTLFARHAGSVAAPTAGLHFSRAVVQSLKAHGIRFAEVTLHVGWGTFAPLPENEDLAGRGLHAEAYAIPEATAATVRECQATGGRIIACGTTAARALESAAGDDGGLRSGAAETELFIQPGYRWKVLDGLLTNFHLPRSSLLMLVCSLAGKDRVLQAYAEAVREHYRFYSYGDAMLIV